MSEFDVLFVHNNFPAQFRNLATAMARRPGVRVRAIGNRQAPGLRDISIQRYSFKGGEHALVHAFARRFEVDCRRAEEIIYAASFLKAEGFLPKLIYVHPGWGEGLPLRALFPDAVICSFAEFYYSAKGTDIGFDPESPRYGVDGDTRVVLRNASTLLSLVEADLAIAPTNWQRSVFPRELQPKITVLHDGLDTQRLMPEAAPRPVSVGGYTFSADNEIVTFVSRNLEPYRGFHSFMRALPALLAGRPRARICIMGGDDVSYGARPVEHPNWRAAMLSELAGRLDLSRVHFLGKVAYDDYLGLLQLSRVHVYLTYPFVLSWSVMEAMALEKLVIGSATPPVEEVIRHGENGLLVPFFDAQALANTVTEALSRPESYTVLRRAARRHIVENYDFESCVWPAHLETLASFPALKGLSERLREPASA
jgi:glycosyltransferase involved in cell wall biosynthesis